MGRIRTSRSPQQEQRVKDQQRAWLSSIIEQLQSQRWYGEVTIKMIEGRLETVMKKESLKPPS